MPAPNSEIARSKLSEGRDVLSTRFDERKCDRELILAAACGGKLRGSDIDSHWTRTASREPGGHVGAATAELNDIEPIDITECVD
jgi:hypothetical protein